MKNVLKNKNLLKTLCTIALCTGFIVIFSTCKDDKCKECTNKVTKETTTYCGDELTEAMLNPALTCK